MTNDLLREAGSRLVQVARVYRRGVDRELARVGVSDAMALPVMVLGRMDGGTRLGALAERLAVEPPSLNRVIDLLVEKKLIERRNDEDDRRAKTLWLTPAGKAMAEQVEHIMAAVRSHLFTGVGEEDLTATLRVLDKLESNLRHPE